MNRMRLLLLTISFFCVSATISQAQLEIQGEATNILDQRQAGSYATVSEGGVVTAITVSGGGSGYLSPPSVTIAAPSSGTTATATATVSGGVVTSVVINSGGSGYDSMNPPAVFLSPAEVPVTPEGTPAVTTPQFSGQAFTSATAGPISNAVNPNEPFPSSSNDSGVTMTLKRGTFGYAFASGTPRYFMGDEIMRPFVRWDGQAVDPSYWRARPVRPGETFGEAHLGNLSGAGQPLVGVDSVTVTESSSTTPVVTVAEVPPTLTTGAKLFGKEVHLIDGLKITLSGNADETISTAKAVPFHPYQPFYFSPHAGKVFASQTGLVSIVWVSAAPDTSNPGESTPSYKFFRETFSVSSGSQAEPRVIYWTEKSFDGPAVTIPKGRIVRVNPVFNSAVPGQAVEYQPVGGGGNANPNTALPGETRTLWFDDQNGFPSLRAYNGQGRVFVEYLGKELPGQGGIHEFLGADIIEIRRTAIQRTINTHLGEQLRPRSGSPQAGDEALEAKSPRSANQGASAGLYGSFSQPDGRVDYFAERENQNPDRVAFFWMERRDAGLHSATAAGLDGLDISWPKFKRNYTFNWPSSLADYVPVNVNDDGADKMAGPQFPATSLPQLVFQDDPDNQEAEIDGATQRLLVDFDGSPDTINRTLLKFSSVDGPWYQRLYIQSWETLGRPEVPDPDGDGPLTGSPPVYTLNDSDADGVSDFIFEVEVGNRIEAPGPGYATAGHVSAGNCYSEFAYLDPLADEGFEAAAQGAIIPVNALPTNNELTIWWFRKIIPPTDKLEPFYVPAIAARYTVVFPETAQELIIASGKGVEEPGLNSAQKSGRIYVQNDPTKIGYNPNEEHALLIDGNLFALRDDLNNAATSSEPFVLLQYTDPEDSRPAMRVAKVVRESPTYPLTYRKIAGTPIQGPMPLTLLPLPLDDNDEVRNSEAGEDSNPDPLPGTGHSDDVRNHYNSFSFEDRKGQHWLFRGPHHDGEPSFGMKFYYYLQDGFWFPGLSSDSQPSLGSIQPFIAADAGAEKNGGDAITLTYLPTWPDDSDLDSPAVLGKLYTGETLALPKEGLPQVLGQSSAQILYQQSIAHAPEQAAVVLHDGIREKVSLLEEFGMEEIPPTVLTTPFASKTYFQLLPPNLQNRFYFDPNRGTKGALVLVGEFFDEIVGEDYLNLNQLSEKDVEDLKDLCPASDTDNKASWDAAVSGLSTTLETFRESLTVPGTYEVEPSLNREVGVMDRSDITDPDTAVVDYVISSTGEGTGYVTLVFGNGEAFTDQGDPVVVQIIKVVDDLYPGDLKINFSSNPLDEKVILRHSGDYGGKPENFEFRWRYGFANDGNPPSGDPETSPNWINPDPADDLSNSILIGGSSKAVLSTPAVLMGDVYFTMSYRKKGDTIWSDWILEPPALVEGWIKRVLAKITPFNQRMTNLYSNSVNTDVSLITQAGPRWVGDIALNLDNINDHGLIEIYETVLNRGKSFTIGSDIDTDSANNALLLAAGYLNDLYTILGNEAFADAANPTISVDDEDNIIEVNTSRFAFESQVASSLAEERALLAGRDDFGVPGVSLAPAYNRLWWNYTRGINSGEALYVVNYNIREKEGSPTADGIVDAADAQRIYPQGHGDAYGHYLTALKGYYKLLTHEYFTWTPSAESITILGKPVLVDYKDERKFAAGAVNLARTAQQILALEHRRSYKDDPGAGWEHFRDGKISPLTGVKRHQGMDETASRATQGAFFHWITANALLPDKDTNPEHSGVQIVDRTTVPELQELPALAESFQTKMDSANARLNPLGLSPGAIAFDLDPYFNNSLGQELADPDVVGKSHYEQISARTKAAINNAAGAFNQAASMTRLLRNQENQIANQQIAIEDEQYALLQELYTIYGQPYAGDIGPGKTYPQGYEDPDFLRWYVIDRPTDFVDTTKPVEVTLRVPKLIRQFVGDQPLENGGEILEGGSTTTDFNGRDAVQSIFKSYSEDSEVRTFSITPNRWAQFADVVGPGTTLGKRLYTGSLQEALLEAHLAQVAIQGANGSVQKLVLRFNRELEVIGGLLESHEKQIQAVEGFGTSIVATNTAKAVLESVASGLNLGADILQEVAEALQATLPLTIGLANDVTSGARGAIRSINAGSAASLKYSALVSEGVARNLEATVVTGLELGKELRLQELGFNQDQLQAVVEFEQTYRELLSQHGQFVELVATYQSALNKVNNLLVDGETIRLRRETLRQRSAAIINGYRTKDLTFRTFRNEALEQYRSLFDLASRYTYLAAKSYDYETGLLGSPAGQEVFNRIVASRALGDLADGVPQATVSTFGDAGLAGSLARLNADFAAAEGRLGINNPDHTNTVFSLRHELFRILNDPEITQDDKAWQQALETHIVPDLMGDSDVVAQCQNIRKPDGTPVPGFVIPFSTTIQHGKNFFGLDLAAGDHNYSPSTFASKIAAVGVAFPGYVGIESGGPPDTNAANALGATPYVYLIPTGTDYMLAPFGDTNTVRSWNVIDQALPLPFNLGASDFNQTQFFGANETLREEPWIIRKHHAFRAVGDPSLFYSDFPIIFTSARLIGRSVWNSQWKLVIPAYSLLDDEQAGMNNFAASVEDINLFIRAYSQGGN